MTALDTEHMAKETEARVKLEALFRAAARAKASDIHLRVGSPPRIRVDGELKVVPRQPVLDEVDTELLAMQLMRPDIAARFANVSEVDFAVTSQQGQRFRVSVYRQRNSVGIVMRLVITEPRSIADLELPEAVAKLADEQRGLVLVTGPTGCGKTTTVAAMIDRINRSRPLHVVTIEDPIEVEHHDKRASISQREVGSDTPEFASAMRVALRQDPDVIFVGEMRDRETALAALSAAETGHLVFSTLHTLDAGETMNRILEFFPDVQQKQARLMLAGTLRGTIGQRLVQGVNGARVPAVEVMIATGRVRQAIEAAEPGDKLQRIISEGEYYGMQTFDQSLAKLIEAGKIEIRDAMAASSNPHDLTVHLRRKGIMSTKEAGKE